MTNEGIAQLNMDCLQMRKDLIRLLYDIQTGHPGGSLSAMEIMSVLFSEVLQTEDDANRDHFILSKGHAVPVLYLLLAKADYFPKEELATLRQIDSRLQGHPCAHKTPGVEVSTGPLGLGVSAALGLALSDRLKGSKGFTYVLTGDGELQEGVVWEAFMAAAKFKPDNLIVIIDHNGVQLDGTVEEIMPMGDMRDKLTAFGWQVFECDGHDVSSVYGALQSAKSSTGKPKAILATTIKGKGISFMEGKNTWHGKPISQDEFTVAMAELEGCPNG